MAVNISAHGAVFRQFTIPIGVLGGKGGNVAIPSGREPL